MRLLLTLLILSGVAQAQGNVEVLGVVPASHVQLGYNINPQNDWEFKTAAANGATWARIQCAWNNEEIQSAPPANTSGGFQFEPGCVSALASMKAYGIHPDVVAAYGPPFHEVMQITVPNGAPAGATSIDVAYAGGPDALSDLHVPYIHIRAMQNGQITQRHSYAGGLVTGITLTDATHATITLASALSGALPADGTHYVINELLYPSAATDSPTDPSVLAYTRYAKFLAGEIAKAGLTGTVEIWNEPPWNDDPWDIRSGFYDQTTDPSVSQPNFGFAAALQADTSPVPGVTYNWGGSHKTGFGSLMNERMANRSGVPLAAPSAAFSTESFHPYGDPPEDGLWTTGCIQSTLKPYPNEPVIYSFFNCNLNGNGGNLSWVAQRDSYLKSGNPQAGIGRSITETGFDHGRGTLQQQARWDVRHFLAYQSVGVSPIMFYAMNAAPFAFVDPDTHVPYPALTALSGIITDLAAVSGTWTGTLPSVTSYAGTLPLAVAEFTGASSAMVAVWQRTTGPRWEATTSPIPVPVTLTIPAGTQVTTVRNLSTRIVVPSTTAGSFVSFLVADDAVGVSYRYLAPTPTSKRSRWHWIFPWWF